METTCLEQLAIRVLQSDFRQSRDFMVHLLTPGPKSSCIQTK